MLRRIVPFLRQLTERQSPRRQRRGPIDRRAAGRHADYAAVNELAATIEVTTVVVAQARSRLAGVMPGSATRAVSLHDRDARPIVRGRIGKHNLTKISGLTA
jgi:IS5 family transposase